MRKLIFLFLFVINCLNLLSQQLPLYNKGKEGSVHISIASGVGFQAYDFDLMKATGEEWGFVQGTYKTIDIGEHTYTSENLKTSYRWLWGSNLLWLNWTDENIAGITKSYDPRSDEKPLSVTEFQKYYGNWFTLINEATSYMTPDYREFRNTKGGDIQEGWDLPSLTDMAQLIGQAPLKKGTILENVLDFVAAGDQENPNNVETEWNIFSNTSGLMLTPLGSRNPGQDELSKHIYAHKKLSKIKLREWEQTFTFFVDYIAFSPKDYHYTQVRFCRLKSDEELGYKIYVDKCNDAVILMDVKDSPDSEIPELPKGLERGIALKYLNVNTGVVIKTWNEIQEEAKEYRVAIPTLPQAPQLTYPKCIESEDSTNNTVIVPDPYKKGEEGSVHIWISEVGTDNHGVGFLAYDFDLMAERNTNDGFQGTYPTIDVGEYTYTTKNLKAIYRQRWSTDFTWLNWTADNIDKINTSHQASTSLPSPSDFQKYYGNWFTFLPSVVSYRYPSLCQFRNSIGDTNLLEGWELPDIIDIYQMIGQTPRSTTNLYNDILDFVSGESVNEFNNYQTEWNGYSNIAGLRLTPLGSREPIPGDLSAHVYSHKKLSKLILKEDQQSFTFNVSGSRFNAKDAHYGQVRYCRAKTDRELGYKMYIDEAANRVVMLPYEANSSLPELPKGLERGIALRYANRKHMKVLRKWSDIKKEAEALEKTLNGEYTSFPQDNDEDEDDDFGFDEGDNENEEGDNEGENENNSGEIINLISYAYDLSGNRIKKEIVLINPKTKSYTEENVAQPIFENINKQKITIYPNPTKGELTLDIGDLSDKDIYHVNITDMIGRVVVNQKISESRSHFNIQSQPQGVYLMTLIVNGEKSVWKIIKE